MFNYLKTHFTKDWFLAEFKIWFCMFLFFFIADSTGILLKIYDKFDISLVYELIPIIGQSVVRSMLTLLFPNLFGHKSPAIQAGTVTTIIQTETPVQPEDNNAKSP